MGHHGLVTEPAGSICGGVFDDQQVSIRSVRQRLVRRVLLAASVQDMGSATRSATVSASGSSALLEDVRDRFGSLFQGLDGKCRQSIELLERVHMLLGPD